MRYVKRSIHLDFHTMPGIGDFGAEFNAVEFVNTLKNANVDFINLFARCNIGFAYYTTKIGIIYPGLKFDLFGEIIRECHKEGIGVAAYFNAGLDHEHAIRHREWCIVNKDGQVYEEDKLNHFFRMMCFNTGYGKHLEDMIKEVLDMYPVDGIWLDCINQKPCYGNECLDLMLDSNINILDEKAVAAFSKQTKLDFAERIRKIVSKDTLLYFNSIPYKDQKDYSSHIEIECLPTGGWGYENFPSNVRYTRNLGKHVLGMTGRFHRSWGDFGGIKTKTSLEFDCYQAISNGAGCSIGDHMHPRCKLDHDVYKLIGNVYSKIKELEPWTDHVRPVTEVAIVAPKGFSPSSGRLGADADVSNAVQGATRLLSELKYQFDIIDEDMDLSLYKLLILPDYLLIAPGLKIKMSDFINNGGSIISSAYSGLNSEKTVFALENWNLDYLGEEEWNTAFYKAVDYAGMKQPEMPVTIYNQGISMREKKGSEVLAELCQPYFNKHWDGFHGYLYIPPDKLSGRPALVRTGNIFQFSFKLFSGYYEYADPLYKGLLSSCIEKVLPEPVVNVDNMPSFGRVTTTSKDSMIMVHLLVYCPELRGKFQVIEEPITATDITIRLRCDGIQSVCTAPSGEKLEHWQEGNYVCVNIAEVKGYKMIVFSKG